MRRLGREERVSFEGEYYRTERATIYDRPEVPVPIYVAASGALAARLAGRLGDGFICTSGKARSSTPRRCCQRSPRGSPRPAGTPAASST